MASDSKRPVAVVIGVGAGTGAALARRFAKGYRVARVRGFDFFPNTHHIEAVAELLLT